MKRIFSILLLVFVVSIAMAQHTYVLTAGISHYSIPNAPNNDLSMTDNDAYDMCKLFNDRPNTTAGLMTSENVSCQNIITRINAITEVAKPSDTIIFFYTGHGEKDGTIYTYDGTQFSYSSLCELLAKAKTKNIYVFLDTCFSGSCAPVTKTYPWITFLVSSSASEPSTGGNIFFQHGVFSSALLKGLRGMADRNGDKKVTLRELYKYAYKDTNSHVADQHPHLYCSKAAYNKVIIDWNK